MTLLTSIILQIHQMAYCFRRGVDSEDLPIIVRSAKAVLFQA